MNKLFNFLGITQENDEYKPNENIIFDKSNIFNLKVLHELQDNKNWVYIENDNDEEYVFVSNTVKEEPSETNTNIELKLLKKN